MNKRFQSIVRGAILGVGALAAMVSMASVAAQSTRPGRPPTGAGAFSQGKPTGTPPAGASAPAAHPMPVPTFAPGKKTSEGEQFFIVASIDLQKSQLLLKYPTEVTLLVLVDNATKFVDESGKPLKLSDFRAGDTVWMVSSPGGQGEATAVHVRKGQMTVADLHHYYLDYAEIK